MILAGALDITISLLLVAHVVVSLLLILVVLMQRPKQEGLGAAFGAGMTDQMFGAQTTNVLQKGTAYFGTAFLVLCLVLSILIGKRTFEKGIDETLPPETEAAMAPEVPVVDPSGVDLEAAKNELEGATPPAPVPASGPTPVPSPTPALTPEAAPKPTPVE
jgi:preprotein translocase subunit SecG